MTGPQQASLFAWLGWAFCGLATSGGALMLLVPLFMATVMAYDSPHRETDSAGYALGAVLFGLASGGVSGWIFGLALPLARFRWRLSALGFALLLLGAAALATGIAISLGGLEA